MSRKLAGPAVAAADLGRIDAVLLSHDHHDDNLDPAGRALLPSAGVVVTTAPGAKRLGGSARGLAPWQTTQLEAPERSAIEITATLCRHGPPLSHPIVGDVVGFALRWEGAGARRALDLGRHRPVRRRARGGGTPPGGHRPPAPRPGQFLVSGPLRYTMTARDAVELCGLIHPRTVIPIHYEGWKHFRQGREAIEREFANAPEDFRNSVRWLPIGDAVDVSA